MVQRIEFFAGRLVMELFRFLPFPLIYAVSRGIYVLIYYIFRYRRRMVLTNLQRAFPEKSTSEINQISKRFYKNLFDVHAEIFKGLTMTESKLSQRFQMLNPELIDEVRKMNRGVIGVGGHYGNFEWGKILFRQLQYPVIIIFNPFANPYAFNYYKQSQGKYSMNLVPVSKTLRTFHDNREDPHCYIMAADQRPATGAGAFIHTFLHQETAFYKGYEQIARKFNIPVVYIDVQRVKRGVYSFRGILLCSEPAETEEGFILELFIKTLQEKVGQKPEDWWLWKRGW